MIQWKEVDDRKSGRMQGKNELKTREKWARNMYINCFIYERERERLNVYWWLGESFKCYANLYMTFIITFKVSLYDSYSNLMPSHAASSLRIFLIKSLFDPQFSSLLCNECNSCEEHSNDGCKTRNDHMAGCTFRVGGGFRRAGASAAFCSSYGIRNSIGSGAITITEITKSRIELANNHSTKRKSDKG